MCTMCAICAVCLSESGDEEAECVCYPIHWAAFSDASKNPEALRGLLQLMRRKDPDFDIDQETGDGEHLYPIIGCITQHTHHL